MAVFCAPAVAAAGLGIIANTAGAALFGAATVAGGAAGAAVGEVAHLV
ncbi:hypothetical protein ACFQU7_40765 [Pseudoroseomonas wenyumeiae]|nr:hypothetical protein [Pseudoroseomonas wenyumeiae]